MGAKTKANDKAFHGVKCEELALGSQERNGIGFLSGRGLPRTLHFHWRAIWAKTNSGNTRFPVRCPPGPPVPGVQPSLRDSCDAERASPTLKRWAIVGESLRDNSLDLWGLQHLTALMVNGFGDLAGIVLHELNLRIHDFPEELGGGFGIDLEFRLAG